MRVRPTETERRRLLAVRDYASIRPGRHPGLASTARVLAHVLDVPICVVGLIDDERVRVAARVGVEVDELPVEWARRLVETGEVVTVVDAADVPPFGPAVGRVRAWAAAPLRTETGAVVGVVLAADREPRAFSANHVAVLRAIANLLMTELEVSKRRHDRPLQNVIEAVERHFEALLRDASDTVAVLDADGDVVYCSPALLRLLGYDDDPALSASRLIHPDDVPLVVGQVTVALVRPGVTGPVEFRVAHADGLYHNFEAVFSNNFENPAVGGVVVYLRDTTERHRATALLEGEARALQLMAGSAPVSAVLESVIDLLEGLGPAGGRAVVRQYEPDRRTLTIAAAPNLPDTFVSAIREWPLDARRTPFTEAALTQAPVLAADLAASDAYDPGYRKAAVAHRLGALWVHPILARRSGRLLGTLGLYLAEPRPLSVEHEHLLETAAALVGLAFERVRAAAEDALAGDLMPRPEVIRRLDAVLDRAAGNAGKVAVLLLDLDRFKEVNEGLGQEGADRVLPVVSSRLSQVVRPHDLVARVAGDEFVVVCEGLVGELEAVGVAERINAALREPVRIEHHELRLTASIGIAMTHGAGDHAEALLRDADFALYHAKQRGRARFELFNENRRREAVARRQLESELERAIEGGELRVWLQPEIEIPSGRLMGFEALVRWEHPERGLLGPGAFIPQAERSGLIDRLGEWVLEEACRVGRLLRDDAGSDQARPVVSVNLSARQLSDPLLCDRVQAALSAGGLEPGDLCLELTESALMEDADLSLYALRSLKGLGVQLAIDDFGTGYSSLAYLRRFPIDSVKIDKSFVTGLGTRPEESAIVDAVLGLTRALGLSAIAEGVEEAHQHDELVRLGCMAAQGFLFSPPRPAAEVVQRHAQA
jgi:diguanylate cyclase (GGDEF)-like protein/PAS domain S-box-containing protein